MRALRKYRGLRTLISVLLNTCDRGVRRRSWLSNTWTWIKRYHFEEIVQEESDDRIVKLRIIHYISERDARSSVALTRYRTLHLEGARDYLKYSFGRLPGKGSVWVARWRVGAVWTSKRAAQAGRIPGEWKYKCCACGAHIGDEFTHLLLSCPAYSLERYDSGLEDLIRYCCEMMDVPWGALGEGGLNRCSIALLGGSEGFRYLTPGFWMGEHTHTLDGPAVAPVVIVAWFLEWLMPKHMGEVWKLAPDRPEGEPMLLQHQ